MKKVSLAAMFVGTLVVASLSAASTQRMNDVANTSSTDEIECLALNIYHEARGQGVAGMVAVGLVTMNRVSDNRFPNTVCGAVKQGVKVESWKTKGISTIPQGRRIFIPVRDRCHFSWYCDGAPDIPTDQYSWKVAISIAKAIYIDGLYKGMLDGANHYHNTSVNPKWAKTLTRITQIGDHIFYRWD